MRQVGGHPNRNANEGMISIIFRRGRTRHGPAQLRPSTEASGDPHGHHRAPSVAHTIRGDRLAPIIFPAYTVGLAAWLCVLEGMSLATDRPAYGRLFEFWRSIFAVAFAMDVVSGIVTAFQFGTNWSELSRRTGAIQGPLLGYESFTAFALEASFFGVLMFGRNRMPRWFYFFSCLMVAIGTTMSSFWIMVNNSWIQYPVGFEMGADGVFIPTDWSAIIFSPVLLVRFPHMLIAAYLTSAFCIAATGAWTSCEADSKSRRAQCCG
jgi:cytochrome d ubiquinol oxidase subunit I